MPLVSPSFSQRPSLMIGFAIGSGARFVARAIDTNKNLPQVLKAAHAHKGASFVEIFRQRARMTIRALRGTKPADLPVEQPSVFQLAINLRSAKAIGFSFPVGLELRADRLIE